MSANWDKRFMELALHVASWSKDRSTKVGAVIVGSSNEIRSLGFNGFPRGCDDDAPERYQRPEKYLWTEHAERNAIYNAACQGVSLEGSRMFIPWFPCMACARAIVQAGIVELICKEPDYRDPKWGEEFKRAFKMFVECGVELVYHSEESE